MERNMERESITIEVGQFLMENGTKIENMVLAPLSIPIARDMKEIGSMDRNTVKEFTIIKAGINI